MSTLNSELYSLKAIDILYNYHKNTEVVFMYFGQRRFKKIHG